MHDLDTAQKLLSDAPHAQTPGARRALVARNTSVWCRHWYDEKGHWIALEPRPDLRTTLWLCFGLFAGGPEDIALANAILGRAVFSHHHPTRNEAEQRSHFDIFVTNHSVQILVAHRGLLGSAARRNLEEWGRTALLDYPGSRQADYTWRGFNDNMPAKATLGTILGGEYFGDPEAVAHGVWNLRRLRELLTRRGMLSEYTTPTYSANTLLNLVEIAHLARNEEARDLASKCAERLWTDILGHYHRPTGTMGGPYSRAYQLDSTGHFSNAACLLWLALGDEIAFHPLRELQREPMRLVHHHDSRVVQVGIFAWIASAPADPPRHLLDWLDRRSYPYRLQASAERGGLDCGEVHTTHYAEADFALGTAEGESWSKLQSEVFFLQYRKRAPMNGVEALRTCYARMLIDDQRPGDRIDEQLLKPHGVVHTLQRDRVSLILARPSLELAGRPIESLRFTVLFPAHFDRLDAVEQRDGHVFIRDGPIYLALRPLNATNLGRSESVSIDEVPNYQQVHIHSYKGPARAFTRTELATTLSGMVAVVGLAAEENFDAFTARVAGAALLDYFAFDMRVTAYQIGDLTLSFAYAPESDRVRHRTVNGRPASQPLWQADGLPAERLPFLDTTSEVESEPMSFPYRHLKVIWGDAPWMIASSPPATACSY